MNIGSGMRRESSTICNGLIKVAEDINEDTVAGSSR